MAETTGLKTVTRLRKYINGKATSETKANQASDPNYIAPYIDTNSCPLYIYNVPTPTPSPTPAPAPGTTPAPTPAPVPVPVPVHVEEEVPIPESSTCSPCITKDVSNSNCSVYTVSNRDPQETAYYQIRDCATGQLVQKTIGPDRDMDVESLTDPFHNQGGNFGFEYVEPADGFSDVDINKLHYDTINCYNNLEHRVVRTSVQLNKGQVVKTENSSCCWEVQSQVTPQQAHNVVINDTTLVYDNCTDCCTATATIPSSGAVITGTQSITANCTDRYNISGVFKVTNKGNVRVKIDVNVISGQYVRATGRLFLNNEGVYSQYVSFPLNPLAYPPYVSNGIDQPNSTIETKEIELPLGTYRLQLEPLECAPGAFGQATLSVEII